MFSLALERNLTAALSSANAHIFTMCIAGVTEWCEWWQIIHSFRGLNRNWGQKNIVKMDEAIGGKKVIEIGGYNR